MVKRIAPIRAEFEANFIHQPAHPKNSQTAWAKLFKFQVQFWVFYQLGVKRLAVIVQPKK